VPRPERQSGLFTALLGDPKVLYYEILEDPERFEDGVSDLVQQLVAGARTLESLTRDEHNLLDRATLDWSTPRHRTPGSAEPRPISRDSVPPAVEHLTYEDALADPAVELEYSEDGRHVPILEGSAAPDIPGEAPETFWWRS